MTKEEAQKLYYDVFNIINIRCKEATPEETKQLKTFMSLMRAVVFKKKKQQLNVFRWLNHCMGTNILRPNLMFIHVLNGIRIATDSKVIAIDKAGTDLEEGIYTKDLIKVNDECISILKLEAVEAIAPDAYEAEVVLRIDWDKVVKEEIKTTRKYVLRFLDNKVTQDGKEVGSYKLLKGTVYTEERFFDPLSLYNVTDRFTEIKVLIHRKIMYPMKVIFPDNQYGFILPLPAIK